MKNLSGCCVEAILKIEFSRYVSRTFISRDIYENKGSTTFLLSMFLSCLMGAKQWTCSELDLIKAERSGFYLLSVGV